MTPQILKERYSIKRPRPNASAQESLLKTIYVLVYSIYLASISTSTYKT